MCAELVVLLKQERGEQCSGASEVDGFKRWLHETVIGVNNGVNADYSLEAEIGKRRLAKYQPHCTWLSLSVVD